MHPLLFFPLLFWTLGCSTAQDLSGLAVVRGQEKGFLTVDCRYDSSWRTYRKYWCQGARWNSCKILVKTDSEQLVKKDRVSIKDNQTSLMFTVTMENLRRSDAGTYWCGIERTGVDPGFEVNVIIDPAPTTVLTTLPTTTTATTTAPILVEKTTFVSTSFHSNSRHGSLGLSALLPAVAAVLLLLLALASLLAWRMKRRLKKAPGLPPEQALQSLDADLCYANLTLQQPRTSPDSSRKKTATKTCSSGQADQAEVAYVTMAPFPKEEVSYAALSLNNLDQEPVYSNTGHLVTHIPSSSQEVSTEYSSVRRP